MNEEAFCQYFYNCVQYNVSRQDVTCALVHKAQASFTGKGKAPVMTPHGLVFSLSILQSYAHKLQLCKDLLDKYYSMHIIKLLKAEMLGKA